MNILHAILGDPNKKALKKYWPKMAEINALEPKIKALSDTELKAKTAEFKTAISTKAKTLDDILPEAFAVVREAARRTLSQRHFDVQLIGGMVLHDGKISEMKTGEGKTQVATLPAYLNALSGKGVHVVTVNDYLSRRDAVWMGQIYSFLGLSVGVIGHDESFIYDPAHINKEEDKERDEKGSFHIVYEFLKPCTRREAYMADITYGTNHEFGFDYLRDNLEYSEGALRQRDFNFAIVDELDSILIDEARTPLIIAAPTTESEHLYVTFAGIARGLNETEDYEVDLKKKAISLTDSGINKAEKMLGVTNIYTDGGVKYVHHLETAVRAKALYTLNKDYVVKDDEVMIVDEFTGRLQPGRRWSEGLHQAIEAKEGTKIQKESRTYASITYQNYFRMYPKLSGMTGTAFTSAEEFYKVYGLEVVIVPTNKSSARKDNNDFIFQTEIGKFKAIARKVKELHKKGQPVLIGTVSIEKNELLSAYLKTEGVPHEILNAKNHEREGEIVAQSGRKGAVTIATNMAGRGVDIKLGGIPATPELAEEIKSYGGLYVLGTERHDARRIDNQLRGRSGRQGDPGETQFFVSMEDSLMKIFASDFVKKMMGKLGVPEDQPIQNGMVTKSLETAQTKVEGLNFDARKVTLEYDDVLNYQRKVVYERRRKLLLGTVDDVKAKLEEVISTSPDYEKLKSVSEEKEKTFGADMWWQGIRQLLLQAVDMFWVDHLEIMDYTRSSVNLRAYGQRDPLVEYKKEGLRLFKEMQDAISNQICNMLPNLGGPMAAPATEELKEVKDNANLITEDGSGKAQKVIAPKQKDAAGNEVGRNDLCPCGSGKKYKKCHGK
ncbi:MAG: preprotein translocase subunit SecA [Candidatus Taylorbacteria bacterium]|nr:preprotein translocase subunit SecA [Candidatus Taylorbacteria bacterium]